uniref:Gametogenetin-binding protein 2 n=1 Tax=Cacopsylla melanoneura TaxID=428564 RepID=A0A8D8S9N0_9HEMI
MARLVDVMKENQILIRRQLPLVIDENLTMVLDLSGLNLICDNATSVRGRQLDEFMKKFTVLSRDELTQAFQVTYRHCSDILDQTIPCIGCRKSVERVFFDLSQSGYPALSPLVITQDGVLTIQQDYLAWPNHLCSLLHGHSTKLNTLASSWPGTRAKATRAARRCPLHSLDSARYLTSRPLNYASSGWREAWDCMRNACKEQVVLIESCVLLATLETYLRKHRFCGECRTKVMRAYTLLVEEKDPSKEKGFVASLYAGIRRCLADKHIHLELRTEFIASLIARAEPELIGNRRERHAKTLEIAQEEVLTCIGICVYERLHKIQMKLREEQCTYQVLATVAVEALCRNFEMVVEEKQGVSQLELCYLGMIRDDQVKQQRRELKKLKKRKRREERKKQLMKQMVETFECENCAEVYTEDEEHDCAVPPPPAPQRGSKALQTSSSGSGGVGVEAVANSKSSKTSTGSVKKKTTSSGSSLSSSGVSSGSSRTSTKERGEKKSRQTSPPVNNNNNGEGGVKKSSKTSEGAVVTAKTSNSSSSSSPSKTKLKRKSYETKTESVDTDDNCVCDECCNPANLNLLLSSGVSSNEQPTKKKSAKQMPRGQVPESTTNGSGGGGGGGAPNRNGKKGSDKESSKKSSGNSSTAGSSSKVKKSKRALADGREIGLNTTSSGSSVSSGISAGCHSNEGVLSNENSSHQGFHSNGGGTNPASTSIHCNNTSIHGDGFHSNNGIPSTGYDSNGVHSNSVIGLECLHSNGSDGGYTSGNASALSSPASSEVACSDGFCNHEGPEECSVSTDSVDTPLLNHHHHLNSLSLCRPPSSTSTMSHHLSLEQMLCRGCGGGGGVITSHAGLDDCEEDAEEEEEDGGFIPREDVEKFHASERNVVEKRLRLRQTLVQRFQTMCDRSRCLF